MFLCIVKFKIVSLCARGVCKLQNLKKPKFRFFRYINRKKSVYLCENYNYNYTKIGRKKERKKKKERKEKERWIESK